MDMTIGCLWDCALPFGTAIVVLLLAVTSLFVALRFFAVGGRRARYLGIPAAAFAGLLLFSIAHTALHVGVALPGDENGDTTLSLIFLTLPIAIAGSAAVALVRGALRARAARDVPPN
jgi:hypothetical protein